ncbi:MAG: hypothetical protein KKD30_18255 [Gammaproteobacteria bacterium]|nr:hypothetical protein [Gammaproteobacteria bacterium]MBU0883229.1 hypothetical protein [Gammaproteobacteria bacterium]MBU1861882.1 hypothetical protein [Gammaproteobacteria bacterium]
MKLICTALWRRHSLPALTGLVLLSCSFTSMADTADWRLLGTMVHANQARSSALLQLGNAAPQRLTVGQALPAGGELLHVGRDHIVVRLNANDTAKLRLQGRLQPLDPPLAQFARPPPSQPEPQPALCTAQQQAPMSPEQREELQALGLCRATY